MSKYREISVVDLWKISKLKKVHFGIKKQEEYMAKSIQYTRDTSIFGETEEEGKDSGYIAYRKDPWDKDIPDRRIVIKHFTQTMQWKGTLEEVVGRGLQQSLAANKGLPSFVVNLKNSNHLIPLEKVSRCTSLGRSIYTFLIIDNDDLKCYPFQIEADRFKLGADWTVYDVHRNKIAEIDASLFNVGGKFTIRIDTTMPTFRKELNNVLELFAALNRYLEDVEKNMEKSMELIKEEGSTMILDGSEAKLYLNPRMKKM